jgi:hypothetical protein
MSKIIRLNENDLKKIVKKVLKERKESVNEQLLIGALIGAALIGGGVGLTWWNGREASSVVKKLFDGCKTGEIGKPVQSKAEHHRIATKINDAIEGIGTDEDSLTSALASIKSVPDVCAVIKEYELSGYGNLYDEIDGDIDGSGWETYVRVPLSNAIRYTQEANEKVDGNQKDQGSGSSDPNANISGEGDASDLQQLLKDKGFDIGSHGVDGKIGPDTLKALIKAVKSLPSGKQTVDEHYLRRRKNIYKRK